MQSTIALVSWSMERSKECSDALAGASLSYLGSTQYSNLSDGFDMVKSHIGALVSSLQISNANLRKELKEKEQALRLAKTTMVSKNESDYVSAIF
jgi:hypothetical protein